MISRLDNARFEREAQFSVQNDAQQAPAPWPTAAVGQQWIIGEDRSNAGQQGIRSVAHAVNSGARFLACDPGAFLVSALLRQHQLPVQRQGRLQRNKRPSRGNPAGKRFVQFLRFCPEEAQKLNEAFACWITTRRPFVTLKSALTLDGQLVLPQERGNKKRAWITSE